MLLRLGCPADDVELSIGPETPEPVPRKANDDPITD